MKSALVLTLALVLGLAGPVPWTAGFTTDVTTGGSIHVPPDLTSVEVSFEGYDGLVLHGSVVAPAAATAPRPGVVLVTGSGRGLRDRLLTEAIAFARQGLSVLIYDKRSTGYTAFRRSYPELATDALGAVRALRDQPGVDPAHVGLWGLSEGGWVAPLAASRSQDVAFVILVGANAMTPIRQQLWSETSALHRQGVSGSLVERGTPNFMRFGADAGLFAEAYYDAPAVLRAVRQPLLGIWGSRDLSTPPGDNPPLFAEALGDGGNTHYAFRFFDGADHAVHETPDGGLTRGPELAPGYAELVGTWVRDVAGGRRPNADAAAAPVQEYPSTAVAESAWWESAGVQVGAFALLVLAFLAYPLGAAIRRLRGRPVASVSRWARLLAGAGLLTTLGLFCYFSYLAAAGGAPDPGPLLGDRAALWLALQVLAVIALVAAAVTAVAWCRTGVVVPRGERVRLGLLLTGGAVLLPWAFYWGLLLP